MESTSLGPRIVIVGAGFGGLYAAKALRRAPAAVLVVDRKNHHLFQPLLYQVATAGLSGSDIARPIRGILRKSANTTVLLGDVTAIDPAQRTVTFEKRAEPYDYLILAPGAEPNYFGHDEWQKHAPALKTLADAFECRRRMLFAFEAAEREEHPAKREPWQTFVVVGGGPTGVELAGALREIATHTMARDFRRADVARTRVVLVDLGKRLLGEFPPGLSRAAAQTLERRGVELMLGRRVTGIDARGIDLDGERLETRTVFWAAGVKPSALAEELGVPLSKDGRVLVAPDLSLPGHPEVFVVGDLARFEQDGHAVPGMAPAAIQEGRHAAENVLRKLRGEPTVPFRYHDRGLLATIGRSAAVARVGRFELAGFGAWVLWLLVHVSWLIGFRNRVVVLFEWAWAYFTFQRTARVAAELERRPMEPVSHARSRQRS